MTKLYGIKNCDTVRKARKWLAQHNIDHEFCDFRESPLDTAQLKSWLNTVGEGLLNKRSTTWKQLSDTQKTLGDQSAIIRLLAEHPTLIKRPVLETQQTVTVGFSADQYSTLLETTLLETTNR